jgi:apolipoprotein D and lipocalin family protein
MSARLRFALAFLLMLTGMTPPRALGEPMQTVPHVDLTRYQGRWYEVARLPLRWENKCASAVTATYTLRSDGKVDVLNQCKKSDGSSTQSHGTARLATNDGSHSKLKVTFFWPFSGDYWILDLDPEYRWVLVGAPNARNLWLLSRTPALDKEVLDRLIQRAAQLGFDTSKLMYTKQD